MLTTTSSSERKLKTPFIDHAHDRLDSPFKCSERVIFLMLKNGHYQCLVPNDASLNLEIAKYDEVGRDRKLVNNPNDNKKTQTKEEEEEEGECCSICLDTIHKWNGVKLDCCKHLYHIFCIIEESKRSTKCPQCRREFKKITRLAKDNSNRLWHMNCASRSRENQPQSDDINDFLFGNGNVSYDDASEYINFDNIKCKVCNRGDREDVLIECDSQDCNNWAHIDCVSLDAVPDATLNQYWYCGECGQISNMANTIENGIKKRSEQEQHENYISLLNEMQDGGTASGSGSSSSIRRNTNNRSRISPNISIIADGSSNSSGSGSSSRRGRRRRNRNIIDTTDLRNTMINGDNDEEAMNCIKDNFLKAATRATEDREIIDIRSGSSSSSQQNTMRNSTSITATNNNNNTNIDQPSEAFLWEQMKLAEEAANAKNSDGGGGARKKKGRKKTLSKSKKSRKGFSSSTINTTTTATSIRNNRNNHNNNNDNNNMMMMPTARVTSITNNNTYVSNNRNVRIIPSMLSSSSSSSSIPSSGASTNVVRKRKRPRLRNRFHANRQVIQQQQVLYEASRTIVDEVIRISRLAVVGLSQTNRFFRKQYDIDLGKATFKLSQSLQNPIILKNLLDLDILTALGQLLAPKIDANGKTIVPHFHFRRRILHFLSCIQVCKRNLRNIGHLVRALVFYSTYGTANEQNQTLNEIARGIVEKWRRIARG